MPDVLDQEATVLNTATTAPDVPASIDPTKMRIGELRMLFQIHGGHMLELHQGDPASLVVVIEDHGTPDEEMEGRVVKGTKNSGDVGLLLQHHEDTNEASMTTVMRRDTEEWRTVTATTRQGLGECLADLKDLLQQLSTLVNWSTKERAVSPVRRTKTADPQL